MPENIIEDLYRERIEWLEWMCVRGSEVYEDDDGEYIIIESDNGTSGEDGYSVDQVKVRLPKQIQLINING